MQRKKVRNIICLLLATCVLLLTFDISADAAQRRRHHNPEAGKGKAAKRIGIGAGIGAVAGAVVGGKKGAAIGAGAGAGAGAAYHVHKKRQYRRRHRRY